MIFPVSPGDDSRLHEITTERVAGGWSREGELALHANS